MSGFFAFAGEGSSITNPTNTWIRRKICRNYDKSSLKLSSHNAP
ncbi:hypothetical protein LEP1GSC086_0978 [Leptospira weilii str. LNT 1234]|nr:hypothetical protein LEP1GSC086_0978 [Leptospira weilii str. LNT 1234]